MARGLRSTSQSASTDNTGCPFFCSHSKISIVCEGIIPGTRIVNHFKLTSDKDVQKDCFCDGNWECCENYRAIMRFKYIEEDDEL